MAMALEGAAGEAVSQCCPSCGLCCCGCHTPPIVGSWGAGAVPCEYPVQAWAACVAPAPMPVLALRASEAWLIIWVIRGASGAEASCTVSHLSPEAMASARVAGSAAPRGEACELPFSVPCRPS